VSILGEGGFGIVYLAEQNEPVQRQVALKVIKPGMDSKQVLARFEAERQALALLNHPNIAHIFDAGMTPDGYSYFVMECVQGTPITAYCDQEEFTIEDRLRPFVQVCDAVQHAHQKGIIHRDLKPSNILVATLEDKPVPVIIDFGVAKAVSQPLTARTLFTEQGQLLGTPEYMSPEQTHLANQDIDTRSDIYGLGVLLYELLTGALPFAQNTLREAAFDDLLKIIREQEPPRPSTRLSSLGEESKTIAQKRSTNSAALTKRLSRELEWIPLKAMRKERDHRYQSARELAEDIANYLEGKPLLAGPESVAYRARKLRRRHRTLVTGSLAVLLTLIGGIIVSMIFALGQTRARSEATENLEQMRTHFGKALLERARVYDEQKRSLALALTARYALGGLERVLSNEQAQPFVQPGSADRHAVDELLAWKSNLPLVQIRSFTCCEEGHVVIDADISADGKTLIVVTEPWRCALGDSRKASVKCYDVPTGRMQWNRVSSAATRVQRARLDPDANQIAVVTVDGYLNILETASGQCVRQLWRFPLPDGGEEFRVRNLKYSPDGNLLLIVDEDNRSTSVYSLDQAQFVLWPDNGSSIATDGLFSPDGRLVVLSYAYSDVLEIWELRSGQCLASRKLAYPRGAWRLTMSRNGDLLASVGLSGTVCLYQMSPLQLLRSYSVAESREGIRFTGSDGPLLLDSMTGQAIVSDWRTGQVLHRIDTPYNGVLRVGGSADFGGPLLTYGGRFCSVHAWKDTGADGIALPLNHIVSHLAISSDNRGLYIGDPNGRIDCHDLITNQEKRIADGYNRHPFFRFDVSPDAQGLAAPMSDRSFSEVNTFDGKVIREYLGHRGLVTCISYHPNGELIASSSVDGTVRLWDRTSARELFCLAADPANPAESVAFSSDGRLVAAGGQNLAQVWDLNTRQRLLRVRPARKATTRVSGLAISPDGRTLAVGTWDEGVSLWQMNGSLQRMWMGFSKDVEFSTDGRILYVREPERPLVAALDWSQDYLVTTLGSAMAFTSQVFAISKDRSVIALGGSEPYLMVFRRDVESVSRLDYAVRFEGTDLRIQPDKAFDAEECDRLCVFDQAQDRDDLAPRRPDIDPVSFSRQEARAGQGPEEVSGLGARGPAAGPADSRPGKLLARWEFDEVSDSNVPDLSGNGLTARLMNGARMVTDPMRGSVLSLDGQGSYVDCTRDPAFHITDAITVTAWIRVNQFDKGWQALVTKGDRTWRLQRDKDNDGIEFACSGVRVDEVQFGQLAGTTSVGDGQWHHVTGVYDGNHVYVYVDGVQDASCPASGKISVNDFPVLIGANAQAGGREWNGLIDDVRIYDYGLSQAEVQSLYQSGSSVSP